MTTPPLPPPVPVPPLTPADPLALIIGQQAQLQVEVAALRAEVQRALIRGEVLSDWRSGVDGDSKDFEARIRLLERFRWVIAGVSATLGTSGGSLVAWLLAHVHR